MVIIYKQDYQNRFANSEVQGQIYGGTSFFNNKEGKTVIIESWVDNYLGINKTNNLKYYLCTTNLQIQNLGKLNGTYITNYVYNEDFINKKQKKLVVYYVGVTNKCRIKVTHIDNWDEIMVECEKV
jgi:hypothetical protein